MGLLTGIRESWAEWLLQTQELPGRAPGETIPGPAVYFGAAPAIPIYTEKRKTLEGDLQTAASRIGLSVLIATVNARRAQNQQHGLWFSGIHAVARVQEIPRTNITGVSASDCAEALAFFTRRFKFAGEFPMQLEEIALDGEGAGVVYDVIFTLEAGTLTPPTRPPVPLLNQPNQPQQTS
jgi:hypothetical protein